MAGWVRERADGIAGGLEIDLRGSASGSEASE